MNNLIGICSTIFISYIIYLQFIWRFIKTYDIGEKGILVKYFGIPIRRIVKYSGIKSTDKVPFTFDLFFMGGGPWRSSNRLVDKYCVLITLKRGWWRELKLITPDYPDDFVDDVEAKTD